MFFKEGTFPFSLTLSWRNVYDLSRMSSTEARMRTRKDRQLDTTGSGPFLQDTLPILIWLTGKTKPAGVGEWLELAGLESYLNLAQLNQALKNFPRDPPFLAACSAEDTHFASQVYSLLSYSWAKRSRENWAAHKVDTVKKEKKKKNKKIKKKKNSTLSKVVMKLWRPHK